MVRVTVLGSGDAFGSGGRGHSAYLVETAGATFLLDCGPTVLQALKRERRDTASIDFVLISHLHGDHFGGIPFLLMEYRYERLRTRPLTVYGPPGIVERVPRLFGALYEKPANEPSPFPLHYGTITPGATRTVGGVTITPFAVPHVSELTCLGYRLEVAGRTIVYSGDSRWTEEFVAQTRGADLFLCECSSYETPHPVHVSYRELAARARDLGCKRLVLSHLGSEPLAHLDEITLECATDGLTIDL